MIELNWTWFSELFHYNEEVPLLFHTGFFLFIFSLFLIVYAFVQRNETYRNYVLILFGFYFYYKASGYFLLLLLSTIGADYLFAYLLTRTSDWKWRLVQVIGSILFSLSFLIYFKYKNFFIENYNELTGSMYTLSVVILPIGISFYTFQSISFVVDIYMRRIALPSMRNYVLYMTFFPHLVAGPIVRASDFLPQIKKYVRITAQEVKVAIFLIFKGFIKKAILGDFVAQYSDLIFDDPAVYSPTEQLVGVLSYMLQIFCDFSGYTDMAIGIALLLGYKLCTNFDSPYKSLNITHFWRRWHISLSSWLRDYIYIPLGGNRRGFNLQLFFLLLTMLIGGFWHGASWKFIFWGAGHGLLLILHKLVFKSSLPFKFIPERLLRFGGWFLTFVAVGLLWVPFRAESLEETFLIYSSLMQGFSLKTFIGLVYNNPYLMLFLVLGFSLTLLKSEWKMDLRAWFIRQDYIVLALFFVILVQVMLQFQSSNVEPFIYFQF
jgi:alginate O-acetyltransferase complex protein AlgI